MNQGESLCSPRKDALLSQAILNNQDWRHGRHLFQRESMETGVSSFAWTNRYPKNRWLRNFSQSEHGKRWLSDFHRQEQKIENCDPAGLKKWSQMNEAFCKRGLGLLSGPDSRFQIWSEAWDLTFKLRLSKLRAPLFFVLAERCLYSSGRKDDDYIFYGSSKAFGSTFCSCWRTGHMDAHLDNGFAVSSVPQ